MKDFFKQVLATITGIVILGIVLTVLGIVSVAGMIASSGAETTVEDNSIFVLQLESVEERAAENPLSALAGLTGESQTAGLDDILSAIKKAAENDKIKGIYIEGSASTAMNPATAQAIRKELVNFKKTGKFIISYADSYSRNAYYIASVADKMLLNPQGVVEWNGMASQVMYYKDALDKIGINMQVFKVGTYKSAVEPYLMNEMSEANREQISSYIGDIWQETLKEVSASRKIAKDSLNAYADRGLLMADAKEYVKLKLIDKLVYASEIKDIIKETMKLEEDDDYNKLSLTEVVNIKNAPNKFKEGEIAVYYACGEIGSSTGYGTESIIDQKEVTKDLRSLRKDEEVKAVVFRVNSPGGSAYDSEQIWKEVVDLSKEKPVVVSMGDYAASGGYYISCAANYIFAEPTTLTGSIGIFGMFPEASDLLNNKLGVHFQTVKTNQYSDLGDLSRPMNEAEQAIMQNNVNRGYELFTKRCADGRKMKQDDIKKIAEGRVWTGNQALKLGLVDALGGLDKAIEKAKELAKVKDCCINTYPAKPSVLDNILSTVTGGSYAEAKLKEVFGEFYQDFENLRNIQKKDYLQTRLPYVLKLN
ncbi:MAG: signal peptide peptidase SppA [Bacteroidales bacterium]|nr:signal peptide peptidase SppA [Bacteroidales bacterium]